MEGRSEIGGWGRESARGYGEGGRRSDLPPHWLTSPKPTRQESTPKQAIVRSGIFPFRGGRFGEIAPYLDLAQLRIGGGPDAALDGYQLSYRVTVAAEGDFATQALYLGDEGGQVSLGFMNTDSGKIYGYRFRP